MTVDGGACYVLLFWGDDAKIILAFVCVGSYFRDPDKLIHNSPVCFQSVASPTEPFSRGDFRRVRLPHPSVEAPGPFTSNILSDL